MPNHVKHGTSTLVSITKGAQNFGITGQGDYGPTSSSGFYQGITPPNGGYTIYYDRASGGPTIHVANNDTQCIFFLKSFGATGSTISDVLAWASNQTTLYVQSTEFVAADLTAIVSTNLMLNLNAGNATSYPGTGTTWNDLSGNANNASIVNGPVYSSSAGGEFSLDGSNDYINLNYTGSDTSSYTYGCWIKLNQLPPAVANSTSFMVRGRDYFGNGWSVLLGVNNAPSPYHFNTTLILTTQGIAGYTATGTSNISINTWYYVVGSWNASTGALKVYINGQLEGTTTTTNRTLRSSTTGWNLGSISNIYYMDCHVGGAQVYSSVLADSDVLQNYNATKTRYGL